MSGAHRKWCAGKYCPFTRGKEKLNGILGRENEWIIHGIG